MRFIEKFNRALGRTAPQVRDMNGGQFRSVDVAFAITHDGVRQGYRVTIERSHPLMDAVLPQRKDSETFWRRTGVASWERIEAPEGVDQSTLARLRGRACQSEIEAREVLRRLRIGLERFNHEMCIDAPTVERKQATLMPA